MKTNVYILESQKVANKFYLGVTIHLDERLAEHNRGKTQSTKLGIPWKIIYTETYPTKGEAMKREYHLKSLDGYKERLTLIEKYRTHDSSSVG